MGDHAYEEAGAGRQAAASGRVARPRAAAAKVCRAGGRKRFHRASAALLLAALASCLASAAGCFRMSSAPYYYVGSLEEVRRDLSGLPGIAYPDVSRYEGFGEATFSVHLYPGDRSIRSGYLIAYDYEQDKVHVRWNGTILSRIEIDGMSFEYFYGDMDFYTDGASLVGYRGARVYERVPMRFEREGPEGYGEYPDGRWVANLFFVVDTDDFVYRICASATLLPSEADPASFYGNIARAKGEAYAVIDSILDQREEPR